MTVIVFTFNSIYFRKERLNELLGNEATEPNIPYSQRVKKTGRKNEFLPMEGYSVVEIKQKYSERRKIPYQRLFSGYYLKRLAYLLYGSVASLPSPSSNIEA